MGKTAVIILSSPRKGSNSGALALAVGEGLVQAGGRIETVDLSRLNINYCLGCESCRRNGGNCTQMDGMLTVYPKIKAADILVLASPIYWFSMCGQLKVFLDRCFALALPEGNALAGKTIAAALSFGAPDLDSSGAQNAIKNFQDICAFVRADWGGLVYGSGQERDTFSKNEKLFQTAKDLGRRLAG